MLPRRNHRRNPIQKKTAPRCRRCAFEPLEGRRLLSATVGLAAGVAHPLTRPLPVPAGVLPPYTPGEVRQAYSLDGSFLEGKPIKTSTADDNSRVVCNVDFSEFTKREFIVQYESDSHN